MDNSSEQKLIMRFNDYKELDIEVLIAELEYLKDFGKKLSKELKTKFDIKFLDAEEGSLIIILSVSGTLAYILIDSLIESYKINNYIKDSKEITHIATKQNNKIFGPKYVFSNEHNEEIEISWFLYKLKRNKPLLEREKTFFGRLKKKKTDFKIYQNKEEEKNSFSLLKNELESFYNNFDKIIEKLPNESTINSKQFEAIIKVENVSFKKNKIKFKYKEKTFSAEVTDKNFLEKNISIGKFIKVNFKKIEHKESFFLNGINEKYEIIEIINSNYLVNGENILDRLKKIEDLKNSN